MGFFGGATRIERYTAQNAVGAVPRSKGTENRVIAALLVTTAGIVPEKGRPFATGLEVRAIVPAHSNRLFRSTIGWTTTDLPSHMMNYPV